jgi:uncharacterized protein YgbK (DUF1537 family)
MKAGVIADDLSGAAELAGAAADMGYLAEVHTSFERGGGADVVAVDADSRMLPPAAAANAAEAVTRDLLRDGPGWLYKKTDSVLRGNVRVEIEAVLKATGMRRALLVPANPSKGRTIRGGIYYVGGVPLAETAFAADPDHPRRSSAVAGLLGEALAARAGGCDDVITVPDVEDGNGLRRLAATVDAQTLPAGGVEFFQAVLELREGKRPAAPDNRQIGRPLLFVCGSAHAWNGGRRGECEAHGISVLVMPEALRSAAATSPATLGEWAAQLRGKIEACGAAMVAIGGGAVHQPAPPQSAGLTDRLTAAVATASVDAGVSTLCVEGGATAAALLRQLGWTRLAAFPSPGLTGVAVLRPAARPGPLVLVKPGSYPWPEQLWRQLAH